MSKMTQGSRDSGETLSFTRTPSYSFPDPYSKNKRIRRRTEEKGEKRRDGTPPPLSLITPYLSISDPHRYIL